MKSEDAPGKPPLAVLVGLLLLRALAVLASRRAEVRVLRLHVPPQVVLATERAVAAFMFARVRTQTLVDGVHMDGEVVRACELCIPRVSDNGHRWRGYSLFEHIGQE